MNKRVISGYPLILNYLGIFSILIGLILLLPLTVVVFRPEELDQVFYFLIPSLIAIVIGGTVVYWFRDREKGHLERNQDAILVVLIWVMAIIYSAIPFALSGTYSITQGIFEATSGFSTTGLTVVDVTRASYVFLLFRSLLQFIGGVGLVLVLTSAISDKFGMRLYNAEGHSDKLMPNLIRSARMILSIYVGYILLGMMFYMIFGMPFFEALNHSICAVATGGFSTNPGSIGAYDSVAIEVVTMVLMILGGTNFFVHLMLLRGKLKNVFTHVEIKLLGLLILIFAPMLVISLMTAEGETFGQSLRIGVFQFLSAITGTGYQTVPGFTVLPETFLFILIILMVLGAGMGSTAGGMKQYRVALAFKSFYWSVRAQLSHKKTIRTRFINKLGTQTIVEKEDIVFNYTFLMTYVMVLLMGTLIFTAFGYSLRDSLFEFASALGTVGLSVGITGYHAHPLILWTATFGMFLGRLEFFVIFVAISKVVLDLSKKKVM
ncbi:MAG: TrkH family potassium uptake protein [Acholeplasmataceae bacterium]|nr:TrkH family potassium uptake protein [Acholeplasmataceae bacterium]